MKHRFSILLILSLLLVASCKDSGASAAEAVAYNDAIVDVQTRVVDQFDQFVDALARNDSLGAWQSLESALDSAQAATVKLKAMPGFQDDTSLRDAATALVQLYARGLEKDFREILPVLVSRYSTLQQVEAADSVRLAFSAEEDSLFAAVEKAQREFAVRHKFEVTHPQP